MLRVALGSEGVDLLSHHASDVPALLWTISEMLIFADPHN